MSIYKVHIGEQTKPKNLTTVSICVCKDWWFIDIFHNDCEYALTAEPRAVTDYNSQVVLCHTLIVQHGGELHYSFNRSKDIWWLYYHINRLIKK